MQRKNQISVFILILIGILIGGLVFSQFNVSTRPQAISAPAYVTESLSTADRPIHTLRDFNHAFTDIAKAVNPTVVTVFTEKVFRVRQTFGFPFFNTPFEQFFDFPRQQPREREYRQKGLGSGVIVSEDGYILTNNHVIADADTIRIRLIDKRVLPAKVIGADPKSDIAVLKIEAKETLYAIPFGNSDSLEVGEWVLAIGSPLSPDLAHTVTSGIVSAKGRSNVRLAEYEDFVQVDAAINPGNSGGALINLDGKLVGINTAIVSRSGGFQGIGFAVPVNMARRAMESIIEHGTVIRGWLGVYIQDVNEAMARAMKLKNTEGVLVSDVTENGPAKKAGLGQGDVILEINGENVENSTQLRNKIASTQPGTEIKLRILRDGKEKTIAIELGKLEADKIAPETTERLEKLFGFRVEPLTNELTRKYNIDSKLDGVVITHMEQGSTAS
ncbi:MAG: Do family serine endopeptidase [bacterium]